MNETMKTLLIWAFFIICAYFHFQDALKQHEALLRMTPAQQAQQIKIWDEESEAESEMREARGY
jgi:uncharacterized protein YacL